MLYGWNVPENLPYTLHVEIRRAVSDPNKPYVESRELLTTEEKRL
jgi:hypothetical protein